MAMASSPNCLMSMSCAGEENHVLKRTNSVLIPVDNSLLISSIMAFVPFILEIFLLWPASDLPSNGVLGPRAFLSRVDKSKQLLTGIAVLPSVHNKERR